MLHLSKNSSSIRRFKFLLRNRSSFYHSINFNASAFSSAFSSSSSSSGDCRQKGALNEHEHEHEHDPYEYPLSLPVVDNPLLQVVNPTRTRTRILMNKVFRERTIQVSESKCSATAKIRTSSAESSRSFHSTPHSYFQEDLLTLSPSPSPSPSLIKILKDEKQNAVRTIDQQLQQYVPGVSRQSIESEILKASIETSTSTSTSTTTSPPSEIGPTGNYEYFSHDNLHFGTRSYHRKDLRSGDGGKAKEEQEQFVFSINFHLEELGPMSLSVDEKYAVRLVTFVSPTRTRSNDNGSSNSKSTPRQRILIRNIATGKDHEVKVPNTYKCAPSPSSTNNGMRRQLSNVEFGPILDDHDDSRHTLFYTECDELGRPHAVFACIFDGTSNTNTDVEMIFQDSSASNFVDVQRTKGCEYVAIHSTSKMSNEIRLVGRDCIHIMDGDGGDGDDSDIHMQKIKIHPKLVRKRQHGIQYFVDCGSNAADEGNTNDLIIMAHEIRDKGQGYEYSEIAAVAGASDHPLIGQELSLFEDSVENLPQGKSFGRPLLSKDESSLHYFIENMELFATHVVVFERSFVDGVQRLKAIDRKSGETVIIPFDYIGHDRCLQVSAAGNIHYQSSIFTFIVESPIEHPITMHYDFFSRKLSKPAHKLSGSSRYRYNRTLVDSDDGAKVPLTTMFDENFDGVNRPIILIGYGAYGENQNLSYEPALRPLVDRGFMISFCHGRGGRELGQQWHEDGCRLRKINGVNDYLACAEYFLSKEFSAATNCKFGQKKEALTSNRPFVVAKAFSAGGIVVGASLNKSPQLFQCASLTNCFLDVMGSMSNSELHLTEHEWDEFGNPQEKEACLSITNYCPLMNIQKQTYPPILLNGAVDDENVPFRHSLVFGKKIRSHSESNNTFINVEMSGGHHLHGKRLEVNATEIAFILAYYAIASTK